MPRERLIPSIPAELEDVYPFGDCVLVQRLEDDGAVSPAGILLEKPARHAVQGLRRGVVLRVGPGDRIIVFRCPVCGAKKKVNVSAGRPKRADYVLWASAPKPEDHFDGCEGPVNDWELHGEERREMGVKPGDIVVYPRVPANDVRITAEQTVGEHNYVFLHEEAHVWAVMEAA